LGAYSCCHSHLNIHHCSYHMQHSVHIVHIFPYSSGHRYYLNKLKNKNINYSCMCIIRKSLRCKVKFLIFLKLLVSATGFTDSSIIHCKSEYKRVFHNGELIIFCCLLLFRQTYQVVWQMAASSTIIQMVRTLLQYHTETKYVYSNIPMFHISLCICSSKRPFSTVPCATK